MPNNVRFSPIGIQDVPEVQETLRRKVKLFSYALIQFHVQIPITKTYVKFSELQIKISCYGPTADEEFSFPTKWHLIFLSQTKPMLSWAWLLRSKKFINGAANPASDIFISYWSLSTRSKAILKSKYTTSIWFL